jgi:transcriptional regulator with XRE-family HTH domain
MVMELTGNHMKAARALLGIDQERLSELSGVSINTIRTQEACGDRPVAGYASTRDKVQNALEDLGIEFTNGDSPGVRLVKKGKSTPRTRGDRKK